MTTSDRAKFEGIGARVEDRHPKLVGGALAYVLERLTEEELVELTALLWLHLKDKDHERKTA